MGVEEEKWRLARMEELAHRAVSRWECAFTLFLDPVQVSDARHVANGIGVSCETFGGYDDAERCLVCFAPLGREEEIPWPIAPLVIRWNERFGKASHRDVLGSLMGLGFKRDALGDILVYQDHAIVFAHESVVDYITVQLERVGSTAVKVTRAEGSEVDIPEPDWQTRSASVASLRLDAVAAAAFTDSRGTVQEACAQGFIKLNHIQELRPDVKLKEGDMISFRGHGRAVLQKVGDPTKKNRLHIELLCTK